MKADEVRAVLLKRWPDDQYLSIAEAPMGSDRSGRRLDLLILSLWRSRGLALDGVEIKVSLADWRRELADGGKAEFWWLRTHRFWLAVPTDIADKVRPDLPETWGLLACSQHQSSVIVKPTERTPEPIEWPTVVGVMRAAADAGVNALGRARMEGIRVGEEIGKKHNSDGTAQKDLKELRAAVAEFEDASGLTLNPWEGGSLGRTVALVQELIRDPKHLGQGMGWQAANLARVAKTLHEGATEAVELTKQITAVVAGGGCSQEVLDL